LNISADIHAVTLLLTCDRSRRYSCFVRTLAGSDSLIVCSHHAALRGILQHNHSEFSIGCDHDLVDGRADFDKGDVLLWMQTLDRVGSLVHELSDQTTVVDGVVLLHGAFDRDSLLIDDDDAEDTHVCVDAVQRFFNLLRRCHSKCLLCFKF